MLLQLLMIRKNEKYQNILNEDNNQEAHLIKIVKDFVRTEKEEDNIEQAQLMGKFIFDLEETEIKNNVPYIYHYLFLRLFNKLIENSVEK